MPQFAAAKLHLIYQITKLLGVFLLQNAHFVGFRAKPRGLKGIFQVDYRPKHTLQAPPLLADRLSCIL